MTSSIIARYIFSVLFFVGCNISFAQTNSLNLKNSNGEVLSKKDAQLTSKTIKKSKDLTHDEIYAEGETIRAIYAKVAADPSTSNKLYTEKLHGNEITVKLYHQQNRIYSIVYRVFNSKNEKTLNRVFDFDEQNNCISNTERKINDPMSYTNAMYWDSLVRFDADYNRIDIDPAEKRQIIQSTKLSIDSLMRHFPEFKYSLNWK